jgi:hypothetical protein
MDDWEAAARLALDAVRTAARIAEREQRRRQRQRQTPQPPTGSAAIQQRPAPNDPPPQRQPIFDMPASPDGDIPDEFLPKM